MSHIASFEKFYLATLDFGEDTSCYTCKIGDEAPKSFDPTAKWEKLSADDKRCAPRLQSFEVSRTMVIQGLPDWGGNDAKQE
ncbi:MAG: hypothetical protein QTN59_01810 [Candidatus Electrothrix communis]|nr:MAG: hypothetical protein QTN59_01810 [Candidatus Electrothrix communis]